jgi:hypothetical protein
VDETVSSITERSPDQVAIEQLATRVKMQPVKSTTAPEEEEREEAPEEQEEGDQ